MKIDPTFFLHRGEIDVDALMLESFHERFKAGESLKEGVSGQLQIDTQYENNVQESLPLVSSDRTRYEDKPAARDTVAHTFPWRKQ